MLAAQGKIGVAVMAARRSWALSIVALVAAVTAQSAFAGTSGNKTGQTCFKGAWAYYQDPASGVAFSSEEACTAFLAETGATLTPYVDLSLTFQQPSSQPNFSGCTICGDFIVHNPAPFSVSVQSRVIFDFTEPGTSISVNFLAGVCTLGVGSINCPLLTVPPGDSLIAGLDWISGAVDLRAFVGPEGFVDPDLSNDFVSTSLSAG
jgi:hypothetical protein